MTRVRLLAVGVALGATSPALPAAARNYQAPPPLPVIRLEGAPAAPARQTPQQPPAGVPPLPVTRLDDRPRAADLDAPRAISLAVAQPRPILDMLILLVRGTPFSVVASDRVDGTFSGELRDLTMRQAIEAVLFAHDLDYDVAGTVIRVFPRRPVMRIFDVNYVNLRRTWQRGMRAALAMPGQAAAADTTSVVENDLFGELEKGVDALLSTSGRSHVDRSAGVVQVTDFADRLDRVGLYLEAVQLRATRQVQIEARVVEVTLKDPAAPSIDWSAVAARAGAALAGITPRGAAGVRVADFGGLLRALGDQGTVRTIAAPRIVATNNEPSVMRVGTEEVYFTPSSQIDPSGRTERTSAPTARAAGLTLTVTAQIAGDGIVQLSLAPTYAERSDTATGGNKQSAPVLTIAEVETVARVQDGETVIVSGLLRDRVRTTPGKGVGGFFGSRTSDTVKSELVIMLTPTVVGPGAAGAAAR